MARGSNPLVGHLYEYALGLAVLAGSLCQEHKGKEKDYEARNDGSGGIGRGVCCGHVGGDGFGWGNGWSWDGGSAGSGPGAGAVARTVAASGEDSASYR